MCSKTSFVGDCFLKTRSFIGKNKGPDNPTSQLLPKMSFNGFSGDREGRKDKGGGERSRR
jgi:hypothetical protein